MIRRLVAVLAIVLPAATASAGVFPAVGVGLGFCLPQTTVVRQIDDGSAPADVFIEVPLVLGGLRIEPELGYGRGSSAGELRWFSGSDEPAGWLQGDRLAEQRLTIGLNVGPTFRVAERMRAWAGARAAVAARQVDFGDDRDQHRGLDFSVGTVAGTETFVIDSLSLGGEARLSFTSVDGAVVVPHGHGPAHLRDGWSLGFDILAAARFYFR